MDAATIAATMVGSQVQNTREAISTVLLKKQNEQAQALVDMLGAALENGKAIQAAPAPGTGTALDVTY